MAEMGMYQPSLDSIIAQLTQLADVLTHAQRIGETLADASERVHTPPIWDRRELAAILCGLRCLQAFFLRTDSSSVDLKALASILTDEWRVDPLSITEVDQLCERLNT